VKGVMKLSVMFRVVRLSVAFFIVTLSVVSPREIGYQLKTSDKFLVCAASGLEEGREETPNEVFDDQDPLTKFWKCKILIYKSAQSQ
jgi:hypothetical protein